MCRDIRHQILQGLAVERVGAQAPPDNDKARTAALRAAFDKMAKDPEFLADAERRRLGSDTLDGQSLQDLVADVAAQPPDVIERMKELTSPPK